MLPIISQKEEKRMIQDIRIMFKATTTVNVYVAQCLQNNFSRKNPTSAKTKRYIKYRPIVDLFKGGS